MKQDAHDLDASDREADSFELTFHRNLGSKMSKTGWGFMLVGSYFLQADVRAAQFSVGSLALPLILCAIGIGFHAKASRHREQARRLERRLQAA
jgi:hypothetical protein